MVGIAWRRQRLRIRLVIRVSFRLKPGVVIKVFVRRRRVMVKLSGIVRVAPRVRLTRCRMIMAVFRAKRWWNLLKWRKLMWFILVPRSDLRKLLRPLPSIILTRNRTSQKNRKKPVMVNGKGHMRLILKVVTWGRRISGKLFLKLRRRWGVKIRNRLGIV